MSCRLTLEHKLKADNIATYLPNELARLRERSQKFANSGCILGGWFGKCYRRMTQMLRIMTYVRRAVAEARKPDHPANGLVAEAESTLQAVENDLTAGFEKHEASRFAHGGTRLDFKKAFDKLREIPQQTQTLLMIPRSRTRSRRRRW